jgi:protein-S-isoprenylcysteine O-methyltransferase Ste14
MSLIPELDFGWATAWWYTAACGITNPLLLVQERMCLAQYGESYRQYMKTIPRYVRPFR